MSKNSSAGDDFFGIEYISSQNEYKEEEVTASGPTSHRQVSENTSVGRKDPTGTEYLDDAFFPGIRERLGDDSGAEEKSFRRIKEDDPNLFDEQYFQKGMRREEAGPSNARKMEEFDASATNSFDTPLKRRRKPKQDKMDRFRAMPEATQDGALSGLAELRAPFIPVWGMNDKEVMELLCQRVIYSDANLIAFDKPYGLPYSGGPDGRPQFDRVLQQIKARVAPKVERLHLVKPLDKNQSGIILFSTNKLLQTEIRDMMESGMVENKHRCLVRGKFEDSPVSVNIPLVKVVKNGDMRLMPLLTNKVKNPVSYVESECTTLNGNESVSYVEVITKKEIPHQLRCHLGFAGCPLIGDSKYNNHFGRAPRLSNKVLGLLDISDNQTRKLPMYSHLKEMNLPAVTAGTLPVRIHATVPEHFIWILRRLRLMKKAR